jgi:hypothetical protein
MSTIDDALVARAAAFGALTALIGSGANMRFFPAGAAPQNATRPFVTYQMVSGPREHAMGADPGMVRGRFQLTAWDDTSTGARNVGDQLRACFSRFRGTVSSVVIDDIFVENEQDGSREPDSRYWSRLLDLVVWHGE